MIAFFINEIDVRGGTHKQFLELLDYVSAKGEPFVIVTKTVDLERTYPGFRRYEKQIVSIGDIKPRNVFRQILRIRKLIRNADVINVHDCGFEYVFPAFWGRRVVLQINDLPQLFMLGAAKCFHFSGWRYQLRVKAIRLFTRLFVDQITVNVSKNAARVRSVYGLEAKVLYCGISPVGIAHDNAGTFRRFSDRKIRLLSSGVFTTYRNYETLVRAVAEIRKRGIDATLDIFGRYSHFLEYYNKVVRVVEDLELTNAVHILGQIDEARYLELHKDSDVFCFVNVDQSWGLAVFEAMSAGLPVVVSNSVGATELLHDGIDATFVDPLDAVQIADSVIRLMEDHDYYARVQTAGMDLIKKYTWEKAYCQPMFEILSRRG